MTHLEVERSKSRSTDRLMSWPKISHIFWTGRPTNFKHDIRMEYADETHHRHAQWPPSWKLWVAVQITTCWGRAGVYCGSPTTGHTACFIPVNHSQSMSDIFRIPIVVRLWYCDHSILSMTLELCVFRNTWINTLASKLQYQLQTEWITSSG